MKKILTALLAVIMIVSTVSIAAFADVKPITLKAPTITAAAGATVEIPITVENVSGEPLRSALFEVKVDGGLEIKSKKLNPGNQKQTTDVVKGSHVRFFWVIEKAEKGLKSGDTLATITVVVPQTATKGDSFNITIIPSDDPSNFFAGENFTGDEGEATYGAVAQNGKITVSDSTPGDVNGDNSVDAKDIILIMRYIVAKNVKPIPTFNETAADFNNDKSIDAKDIILIMRHIVSQTKK